MSDHTPAKPSPLACLRDPLPYCPALLMGSFAKTHAGIVTLDDIRTDHSLGLPVTVGDLTHLPSGQRYLISITPIPQGAA